MIENIDFMFEPLVHEDTEILICGSFPSPASRADNFFYGHPQNRFWPLMAKILEEDIPTTIEQKTEMLRKHKIGLTDAAISVSIKGAADSTMRDIVPNDLDPILKSTNIKKILANGRASYNILKKSGYNAIYLPSTSPANAAYSIDRLYDIWAPEIKNL